MTGIKHRRRSDTQILDRTVYLEIYGSNKTAYRVIAGRVLEFGRESVVYGVEAEDFRTGEKEYITDFSRSVEEAVEFAEELISSRSRPIQIYSKALGYLCVSLS